jgi:hypothetical protein
MRRSSDGCVIHAQIAADGTDDNLTRVQSNADLQIYAEGMQRTFGMPLDLLLHTQGCVAGAHGMVLVGDRSAEQRHDAIACRLVDGTLIVMNRLHHQRQDRLEKVASLFRVAVGEQFRRALGIGKQHGNLLALAFDCRPGVQDLLS